VSTAIHVAGRPTGRGRGGSGPAWRERVSTAAAGAPPADGIALAFTLPPARWVDLDTLAEETLAGLRDAGVCRKGFAGLDAVLATRRDGTFPGVVIEPLGVATLRRRRAPGPVLLDATGYRLPQPGRREDKRAWRERLDGAWAGRPPMADPVWVDLELRLDGSLLGPLEPSLDALEPVLGRDPRGRDWQEFFPNDHLVRWLRVRRSPTLTAALRLRLGTFAPRAGSGQAIDSGGAASPAARPRAQDQA